jgi:predicted transcriptional regulator
MQRKSIGDRELMLLNYVGRQGEASVGEVAGEFGEARGLARSTVLTMMERLRTKGFLKRRRSDGVFRYSTTAGEKEVVQDAVASFVEKTLQGSVSPFVAWMSRRGKVSDEELAALEALVEKLQATRKGD